MTNGFCALLVNLINITHQNSVIMHVCVNVGLSQTAYLNLIHALNPLFYWLLQLLPLKIVSDSEMSVSFSCSLKRRCVTCCMQHPSRTSCQEFTLKVSSCLCMLAVEDMQYFLACFIWAVPHTYPLQPTLEQKVSVWMQRWSVWRPNTQHCIWCL